MIDMATPGDYRIHADVKFGFGQLIDVPQIVKACKDKWFNQTLCEVNECVVRLGIVEGEFHWHTHDDEDEFFFVLDGKLIIDLDGETVALGPQQGYTVARGTRHRTRAKEKTMMLMVEKSTVVPTGDNV
ncbi:MAG: cupin domain-containing protein [Gemmatimonadetes bacterium]|nr:cupin domain-containing protein [Gemmatimonadota bacterium]